MWACNAPASLSFYSASGVPSTPDAFVDDKSMTSIAGIFQGNDITDLLCRVEGCEADLSEAGFERIPNTADWWVQDSELPPDNCSGKAWEPLLSVALQHLQQVPEGKKILRICLADATPQLQFTPEFLAALGEADVFLEVSTC